MNIRVREATSAWDFEEFAGIIVEYFGWMKTRYRDEPWVIEQVAAAQSLDRELQDLSSRYRRPQGLALRVEVGGRLAGAGAWRRLADGSAEMKRVFVRDEFKGRGVGRALCQAIMDSARHEGYALMRLDTGKRMTEAQALYRALGFVSCAPYQDYPASIIGSLEFMEVRLAP